jgi:tRNA A37 threonylcarbamoyltransferase TsaD
MVSQRPPLIACGRLGALLAQRQHTIQYGKPLCLRSPVFRRSVSIEAGNGTAAVVDDTRSSSHRSLLTLAIETSCDDTCVAILEKRGAAARLLHNDKATSDLRRFRGVEPRWATVGHTATLASLVDKALRALPRIDGNKGTSAGGVIALGPDDLRRKPDFVSVTGGPGMRSSLSVGLNTAKGLAVAWQVPLVIVHHMKAHALTPRLVHATGLPWPDKDDPQQQDPTAAARPAFPFLTLLVSGGHTQLVLSRSVSSHTILADARNVAIGDMLDKCARAILPEDVLERADSVMYGRELERFAFPDLSSSSSQTHNNSNPYDYHPPISRAQEIQPYQSPTHAWVLKPPIYNTRALVFDFSGFGGDVRAIATRSEPFHNLPPLTLPERRELARETMRLAFEHLCGRVILALQAMKRGELSLYPDLPASQELEAIQLPQTLVISGGVAANTFLMHVFQEMLQARGYGWMEVVTPPAELCTDNAAMVAWAGMEMFESGEMETRGPKVALDALPRAKWPLGEGLEEEEGVPSKDR